MEIRKINGVGTSYDVSYASQNKRVGVASTEARPSVNPDAVTLDVASDFESEQRSKVARLSSAVKSGEYKQPSSRELANAVVSGLDELIGAIRG